MAGELITSWVRSSRRRSAGATSRFAAWVLRRALTWRSQAGIGLLVSSVWAGLFIWFFKPALLPSGPGSDYAMMIWGPARGLLGGYDVYNPSSLAYVAHFGVEKVASLHTPSVIVLFGWTAVFPVDVAFALFAALSALCLGLALLLLLPTPTKPREQALTLALLAALELSWPARTGFVLGQLTPVVALGAALAFRSRSTVEGALGVVLMAISPQTAVPVTLLTLALRRRRGLVLGWLATAALSLPVLSLASYNAHGLAPLLRALREGPAELVNQNRIDLPYFIGGLKGDALGLSALLFVASVLALYWSAIRAQWTQCSLLVVAAGLTVTVPSVYHQPYDLVLTAFAAALLVWGAPMVDHGILSAALVGTAVALLSVNVAVTLYALFRGGPIPSFLVLPVATESFVLADLMLCGVSLAVLVRFVRGIERPTASP